MVDASDLYKAMHLQGELQTLRRALDGFDRGEVINAMTVGPKPDADRPDLPQALPQGITVSTAGIAYPQAMVDAICASLQQREQQVSAALQALGVTGVNEGR